MAAQSLSTEKYVYGRPMYEAGAGGLAELNGAVAVTTGLTLTGEGKHGEILYALYGKDGKDRYTIQAFRYKEEGIIAEWTKSEAEWIYSEEDTSALTGVAFLGEQTQLAEINDTRYIPPQVAKSDEPSSEELTTTEEPITSEEEPTTAETIIEDPIITDPDDEDPDVNPPLAVKYNEPDGTFAVIINGELVPTGQNVEADQYWPDAETINEHYMTNGGYGYFPIKAGDIFLFKGKFYWVMKTVDGYYEKNLLDYSMEAIVDGDEICPILYDKVLTKADQLPNQYNEFSPEKQLKIEKDGKGTLYYSEDEHILYITQSHDSRLWVPTKNNHPNWIIFKEDIYLNIPENTDDNSSGE